MSGIVKPLFPNGEIETQKGEVNSSKFTRQVSVRARVRTGLPASLHTSSLDNRHRLPAGPSSYSTGATPRASIGDCSDVKHASPRQPRVEA